MITGVRPKSSSFGAKKNIVIIDVAPTHYKLSDVLKKSETASSYDIIKRLSDKAKRSTHDLCGINPFNINEDL